MLFDKTVDVYAMLLNHAKCWPTIPGWEYQDRIDMCVDSETRVRGTHTHTHTRTGWPSVEKIFPLASIHVFTQTPFATYLLRAGD